jgi:hypothetical protein
MEYTVPIRIESLGEGIPGGQNVVIARVTNKIKESVEVSPAVAIEWRGKRISYCEVGEIRAIDGPKPQVIGERAGLFPPGEKLWQCRYDVPGAGVRLRRTPWWLIAVVSAALPIPSWIRVRIIAGIAAMIEPTLGT